MLLADDIFRRGIDRLRIGAVAENDIEIGPARPDRKRQRIEQRLHLSHALAGRGKFVLLPVDRLRGGGIIVEPQRVDQRPLAAHAETASGNLHRLAVRGRFDLNGEGRPSAARRENHQQKPMRL